MGRPSMSLTEKGKERAKSEAIGPRRCKGHPIPDDYAGRRLYVLEMLAEIAEHYESRSRRLRSSSMSSSGSSGCPTGRGPSCCPLTEAGEELMDAYKEERQAEAEGASPSPPVVVETKLTAMTIVELVDGANLKIGDAK